MPVSQPWAGAAFGGINLPRVGQEVIVDFLGGDPDRPMITGRVYTASQPVPYKLPDNKTQSGWKSNSTGGTGGYNEIMFEDSAGKELVRIQAEKDLQRLVKNDEDDTVGHDRIRDVKHNEEVTIGNNRTHRVVANERIHIGQNQAVNIGVNRATSVGMIDSTVVGETFVMMVIPPGEGDPGFGTVEVPPDRPVLPNDLEDIVGPPGNVTVFSGKKGEITLDNGEGARILVRGSTITLQAPHILLCGNAVDIMATGKLTLSGEEVHINGPGPNAARLGDGTNSVKILEGASTVFIGEARPTSWPT